MEIGKEGINLKLLRLQLGDKYEYRNALVSLKYTTLWFVYLHKSMLSTGLLTHIFPKGAYVLMAGISQRVRIHLVLGLGICQIVSRYSV